MNYVKRAIIMAAGIGSRMRPITIHTPKPLVKVNGVSIIETIINGLHKNNIYEIYVVVGYLKEKFFYLENKYPGLKIVENPYYATCNNISSLYVTRKYIPNSIIIDGDQIIYNPNVLNKKFEFSGYNSVWINNNTKEWLQSVDENGIVQSCSRIGGNKGWRLYSVSRWTEDDGNRLIKYLEIEFEQNKNTQIYWDDVAMFYHKEEFKLGVWPMEAEDIIEIDTIDELISIDSTYENYMEGMKCAKK